MKKNFTLCLTIVVILMLGCKKDDNSKNDIPAEVGTTDFFISFTKNAKDTIISSPTCNYNSGYFGEYHSTSTIRSNIFAKSSSIQLSVSNDSLQLEQYISLINKKLQLDDCLGCGESAKIEISLPSNNSEYKVEENLNPLPNYYLIVKSVAPSRSYFNSFGEHTRFYIITGEFKEILTDNSSSVELTNGKFKLEFAGVSSTR